VLENKELLISELSISLKNNNEMREEFSRLIELNKEINHTLNEREEQIGLLSNQLATTEQVHAESSNLAHLLRDSQEAITALKRENDKLQENVALLN